MSCTTYSHEQAKAKERQHDHGGTAPEKQVKDLTPQVALPQPVDESTSITGSTTFGRPPWRHSHPGPDHGREHSPWEIEEDRRLRQEMEAKLAETRRRMALCGIPSYRKECLDATPFTPARGR